MKTFLNIIFVYIPFVCCILVELGILMMMYQGDAEAEGLAAAAKWAFPFLFIATLIVHYTKILKK